MLDKLKIGGHVYRVKWVERSGLDDQDCGNTDRQTNTITIDKNLAQSQKEETLIHEIFHAINGTMDHVLLDSLAHQWHQVLVDNCLLKDNLWPKNSQKPRQK